MGTGDNGKELDVEKERLRAALSCAIEGLKYKDCSLHLSQISAILAGTKDADVLKKKFN